MRATWLAIAAAGALAASGCATTGLAPASEQAATSCGDQLQQGWARFDLTVFAQNGREVPVTVYHPARSGSFPIIGFSHGAYAAPGRYEKMLGPLAGAGFVVIAPMHVDSEELTPDIPPPPPPEQWRTRNEDLALALSPPSSIIAKLADRGISARPEGKVAMGHSYGTLMAQAAAGAEMKGPGDILRSFADPAVSAVVAWSPPKPIPGFIGAEGWAKLAAPSLTITGTADVMPGFVDDWQLHKASYENAPSPKALWVGEGIDHYFNGMFGREKPASAKSQELFERALAQTLGFIEAHTGQTAPCSAGQLADGESWRVE